MSLFHGMFSLNNVDETCKENENTLFGCSHCHCRRPLFYDNDILMLLYIQSSIQHHDDRGEKNYLQNSQIFCFIFFFF